MDKKQNKKFRNKDAIQFILSNRDANDPNYNNPNASQKILLQVNNDEDLTKEQKKIIEQIPKISRGIFDEKEATKLLLGNNSEGNDNKGKVSFNFKKNEVINFNKNEKISNLNKNKKVSNNEEEEIDTSSKKLDNKNINDFIKSNEDLINDEKYIKEILKKVKVKAKIVEYNEFGLPKDTDPEVLKYASNKEFIEGVDIFIPAPVNNITELNKFDTDIKEENMDEEMKELEKELKSDSEEENNNNKNEDTKDKNNNEKNEIIEEGNIEDNFILLANGGELPIEFINEKEEEDKIEPKKEEEDKNKENELNNNDNIINKYTNSNQYKYITKEEINYVFKKFEEEEEKKKKNKNNNKNNFSDEDEEYEDYELDEEALMDYNRDDLMKQLRSINDPKGKK